MIKAGSAVPQPYYPKLSASRSRPVIDGSLPWRGHMRVERPLSSCAASPLDTTTGPQFTVWLVSKPRLELIKTSFRSPTVPDEIHAVRGKTPRAHSAAVTFQWTAAVQAFTVFILRAAALGHRGANAHEPIVEGGQYSIASSIDYALYKENAWLDLFGGDIRGDALSKRIIVRTNPGRRRPGPVTISLNERMLPKSAISVVIDDKYIQDPTMVEKCADVLETRWRTERAVEAPQSAYTLENQLQL